MRGWIIPGMAYGLLLSATASLEAANITILQGSMEVGANNASGIPPAPDVLVASLPLNTTINFSDGLATNSTTYDFSNSGFHISVDHMRPSTANSQVESSWFAPIKFTLDQDESYSISGNYSETGTGRFVYYFELQDVTSTTVILFKNRQLSTVTPDESFTLGLAEGDGATNEIYVEGSLNGTLLAGRTYLFAYQFLLQRWAANSGAEGNGFIDLQIGNSPTLGVPEPSTGVLALLGILGVGLSYRRRS